MRVATVVIGPATEEDDVPEVDEDDTQLLKTGDAADATSVIPTEDLDKVRSEASGSEASWYEVLEPGAPAEESDEPTDLVEENEQPAEPAEPGEPDEEEEEPAEEEDEPRTTRIRKRTTRDPA